MTVTIQMKGTKEQIRTATYKLATDGYLYELTMLVKLIRSSRFEELLDIFANYEQFISSEEARRLGNEVLNHAHDNNRTIQATDRPEAVQRTFACANLAACCQVFSGWTIPAGELQLPKVREYLQLALSHATGEKAELGRNLAVRLNKGDTARVTQLLRLLGLIRHDTGSYYQLSLGASVGERDRHALHQTPFIRRTSTSVVSPITLPPLAFGCRTTVPQHIVMIDKDPNLSDMYQQFNREIDGRTLALNLDVYDGLGALATRISNGQEQPRDLVVGFRLEPRGYPDIPLFFDLIGKVIASSADFVVTVGAGDELTDFKNRIQLMADLDKHLSNHGMKPVRVKQCRGKDLRQQHQNPTFGLSQYASYEIIYCRLERALLLGRRHPVRETHIDESASHDPEAAHLGDNE